MDSRGKTVLGELYSELSDTERMRIRDMFDHIDNATMYSNAIGRYALEDISSPIADATAASESLEQTVIASVEELLAKALLDDTSIQERVNNSIDRDISAAIEAIVATNQTPTLSPNEEWYYDNVNRAAAYQLTSMSGTMPEPAGSFAEIDIGELPGREVTIGATIAGNAAKLPQIIIDDTGGTIRNPNSPPVVFPPSNPPIIPSKGKILCYLYTTDLHGNTVSIPNLLEDTGKGCPTGYYSSPYIPPISPPPPIPSTKDSAYYNADEFLTVGGVNYKWSGVSIDGKCPVGFYATYNGFDPITGGSIISCYAKVPPIPPMPPSPTGGTGTGGTAPGNPCILPFPDFGSGGKSKSKDGPLVECPPGCVRIDSVIPPAPGEDSCTEWDNESVVCRIHGVGTIDDSGGMIPTVSDDKLTGDFWGALQQYTGYTFTSTGGISSWIPSIFSAFFGSSDDLVDKIFQKVMAAGTSAISGAIPSHTKECDENIGVIVKKMMGLAIAAWAERLSGAPLTYLWQDSKYDIQFNAPRYLPDQSAIDAIYLSGGYTREQWQCYTRALGNLTRQHEKNVETKRTRINPNQAIFLNRYDKLPTDKYVGIMRSLGFMSEEERKQYEDSLVMLPGISDITRFMVRDAADKTVVTNLKLDDGFDKKFIGILETWAKAQGIPREAALFAWRSHWEYPSNTAIYEFVRRLRPGRTTKELEFTKQDALDVLAINDVVPGMRERILATSYMVINRTDIKRAYQIDAYDSKEVIERLQDVGYTKSDSESILKIFDKEKELYKRGIAARNSAFTPKQIANSLAAGDMSEADARSALKLMEVPDDMIDKLIASSNIKARTLKRRNCLRAVKRKYMNGIIDAEQMTIEVFEQGTSLDNTSPIVDAWKCEFASRAKELPASKNLYLFVKGIITQDTLITRLRNLNYTEQAIDGWIAEGIVKQREAIQAAMEKAQRAAEKARREYLKQLKEQQKRAEEMAKQNKTES